MEEEPFQKITIKAVCAHAGVSRQTFYSLFENKEEVIGRRLDRLLKNTVNGSLRKSALTPFAVYVILLWSVLWSRKNSLSLLVENRLDTLAREKSEAYLLHLDNTFSLYDHEDRDYAISFLTGAIISMVVYAIRKDDFTDSRKISNLVQKDHYRPLFYNLNPKIPITKTARALRLRAVLYYKKDYLW